MSTRKQYLKNKKKRRPPKRRRWLIPLIIFLVLILCSGIGFLVWHYLRSRPIPEDTVRNYFSLLNDGDYEGMYALLTESSKDSVSEKDFISRNQNIYEGIEASNIKVSFPSEESSSKDTETVTYSTSMDTCAGSVSFDNQAVLEKDSNGAYRISWDSTLIFPSLQDDYKVRVETETAERGSIYDRNGTALATQGTISEVGLVPGKMSGNKEEDIQKIAELLDMSTDDINSLLGASYVQDDTFVPLKQISKDDTDTESKLLEISGILINDAAERIYPLGAAAGHLTGYVQSVTAEDLEKKAGEGYHAGSVIGKSGLELAYEDTLRAVDGSSVNIVDSDGNVVETLASQEAKNGEDIHVTIDASLQQTAYDQFSSDNGTAVAMNPKTGEVLALVSTPGYDPNEFIMGMSDRRWEELNNSENRPLTNRFAASWVPGSTFKALTAVIGVDSGKIDPQENFGYEGLSWHEDSSWGDYHVTTLTDYGDQVNLENALVYSDNIYFAKAALKIGADTLIDRFKAMGFDEEIPFELSLTSSTYDDDDNIDSDIQLADTGYGQGQLLVNPVHMLSMYSLFVNDGSMIQPTLLCQDGYTGKMWKENVFSADAVETVRNDLIQVIENPSGTGASARIDGVTLLGKTGTAEIKDSQSDTDGIERGWFICETADSTDTPIAVAGMVEDVKGKGGSSYVTEKVRNITADYLGK
ncbi:penicillin-binding transpeptidase domain-containing protein [Mediterraneibacter glycyrrhizinilyticus]|uniref:penicillin-binding transpeptidase domain-containing protein n=1 Tax=Mediterraneibacter glycyrrhizinilyticus TaxID=342942 RepID=UPI0019612983|nr:penicillin-binding transpeptidase domain-containing protein [Mediterraneibacter glycyrrhizinilyticus]MBM6752929.1 penicillin-binding transpeptidase domain-containing protein [Mediterraneibacter glycyrrhizinilyticus]